MQYLLRDERPPIDLFRDLAGYGTAALMRDVDVSGSGLVGGGGGWR